MTTIRATCATCGDVELTTDDVSVMVSRGSGMGTYSFRCPRCGVVAVKECPDHAMELLVAAGVAYCEHDARPEQLHDPTAAVFSHDDLFRFHAFLADDAQLAGALEGLLG